MPASLTLSLANSVLVENGAATTGTVTRTGDLSQALSVALASSDLTEATAPASVTIPAGLASATFPVTPVDDTLVDGTQSVTLTANAPTGPTAVGPDTTFGNNGLATVPQTGGSSLNPSDVLVRPDGKVVTAGATGTDGTWAVTWLNPNGSIVVTAYTSFAGTTGAAVPFAVARQPDGKVLVAGSIDTGGIADWGLARYNPDGTPDLAFGTNGVQTFNFQNHAAVYALHVEADGNILAAGVGYGFGFYVARLSPTGARIADHTTAVTTNPNTTYPAAYDMAVTTDGKIYLTGRVAYEGVSVVARLDAQTLSPDTSFGPGGYRTLAPADFGANYVEVELHGVKVQPDGKVVVGGTVWRAANIQAGEFAAARYNADGTLDTSFLGDGTATVNLAGGGLDDAAAYALALQPDGKIVLGGYSWRSQQGTNQAIARLNTNGTPDQSFNGTGWFVAANHPSTFEQINAIALQPDGRLVAESGYDVSHWVARFDMATGEALTATAGLTVADDEVAPPTLSPSVSPATFGETAGATAATATVTRSNTSLAADLVVNLTSSDTTEAAVPASVTIPAGQASATFAVATVDDTFTDGTQAVTITASANAPGLSGPITYDSTWGPNGGWQYGLVRGRVAIAPDGKLVVAGSDAEGTASGRLIVARYNADGSPDATFGAGGIVGTVFTNHYERATDVAVQPNGKIVVAATLGRTTGGGTDSGVLRYNADGTPDTGFGTGGQLIEAAASNVESPTRVIVQTDGRILVAGTAGSSSGGTLRGRFLRLSPAGVLENRNDSAWSPSRTEGLAQDGVGNIYLAYGYGSSATSGYVDRYRSVGATVSGTGGLNVLDNEPFAAVADTYSATEETTLTVSASAGVRTNDTVTNPISVTAELVAGPARGTLTFNADGSFTYTPGANVTGTDSFTYRLRDGIGVTNTATVTINVANTNDAPVAVNDSYTTAEDTPLTVSAVAGQTSLSMVSDRATTSARARRTATPPRPACSPSPGTPAT